MKRYSLFMLSLLCSGMLFSQQISQKAMLPLFKNLSEKSWDSAFTRANLILQNFPSDTSEYKALTRYAAILSAAGRVSTGKMTYMQLRDYVWPFLGQQLLMPGRPTTTDTNSIASGVTMITQSNGGVEAATITRDRDRKTVLLVENFRFDPPFDISGYNKTSTRCGGKLLKIEINPRQDNLWIMRIFITEPYIRKI